MRKLILFAASASLFVISCAKNPDGDKAETKDAVENSASVAGETFMVDSQESSVIWTGSKVTGSHHGTVNIKEGEIIVESGLLTGGNFTLDMNSIVNQDLEGEWNEKLVNHLKSDDFFAVNTYPEATFEITSVQQEAEGLKVSGNLTLRGVSKNITFNATLESISDEKVEYKADFNIAREDWGVSYTGKKDDLISKEINFKIKLVATR